MTRPAVDASYRLGKTPAELFVPTKFRHTGPQWLRRIAARLRWQRLVWRRRLARWRVLGSAL